MEPALFIQRWKAAFASDDLFCVPQVSDRSTISNLLRNRGFRGWIMVALGSHRASRSCWTATVCEAPVAAGPQPEIGFFIQDRLLRLVFDTAALRMSGDECSNNLEMHRRHP
jgi:hypothetical protein